MDEYKQIVIPKEVIANAESDVLVALQGDEDPLPKLKQLVSAGKGNTIAPDLPLLLAESNLPG